MSWEGVEWELVTDFASLKAGDYVEDRACQACGSDHCRVILTTLAEFYADEQDPQGFYWLYEPECSPGDEWEKCSIAPSVVAERHLYRAIIPGLEASQSHKAQKRKPVGAR